MVRSTSFNELCSHVVNIGIYDYKPNHGRGYIYGSIHRWGTKKGKKGLKDFLELLFTNNICMKQT
jgi:hypothetical protein